MAKTFLMRGPSPPTMEPPVEPFLPADHANPYVGPRPFTEQESVFFYGRATENQQLSALVIAHRVVLFYASSGAGKTSLLRAGVIPELQRKRVVVLPIARVVSLVPATVAGLASNIFVFNTLMNIGGESVQTEAVLAQTLQEGLRPHLSPATPDERITPRLLILDQFEEIFTTYSDQYEKRADFFRQLQECLTEFPQLSLLISMREDYIARLDAYAGHFSDRLRIRYRMERLPYAGALAAVREPAAQMGRPFAPQVAEALVNDLRRIQPGQPANGSTANGPLTGAAATDATATDATAPDVPLGEYVEPVHLQIVCRELWRQTEGKSSISQADLAQFGKVDNALISFYSAAIQQVISQTPVRERALREWVNTHLITPKRTRGLVYRGEKSTEELPNAAVDVLNNAYIIRAETRGSDHWYELAHDRLVEPILHANHLWQSEHGSPFTEGARRWNASGRAPEWLLAGNALAEAESFVAQRDSALDDLDELETQYLSASKKAAKAEHLRQRNRWLMGVILLGFVTLLAAWGWANAKQAEAARDTAENAKVEAQVARATADAASTEANVQQERAVAILNTAVAAEADRITQATIAAAQTEEWLNLPPLRPTPTPTLAPARPTPTLLYQTNVLPEPTPLASPDLNATPAAAATPTPLPTATLPATPDLDATATAVFLESQSQSNQVDQQSQIIQRPSTDGLRPAPFEQGVVVSYGGAKGDFLLQDPTDELSGYVWVPVGTPVTVLGSGRGSQSYGSGLWYFVEIDGLVRQSLQGWLPAEVVSAAE